MSKTFILLLMIFLHILDDFYLQGLLINLKQKKWWEDNIKVNYKKYKNDYIIALIMHGFSWSFVMMLPVFYIYKFNNTWIEVAFVINLVIHSYVDNFKANDGEINLIQDQLIHLTQIIVTWLLFVK